MTAPKRKPPTSAEARDCTDRGTAFLAAFAKGRTDRVHRGTAFITAFVNAVIAPRPRHHAFAIAMLIAFRNEMDRRGINYVGDFRAGLRSYLEKTSPVVLAELEGDRKKNYPARDARDALIALEAADDAVRKLDAATAPAPRAAIREQYDELVQKFGAYVSLDADPRQRYVLASIVRTLREDPFTGKADLFTHDEIGNLLGVDPVQVRRALDG